MLVPYFTKRVGGVPQALCVLCFVCVLGRSPVAVMSPILYSILWNFVEGRAWEGKWSSRRTWRAQSAPPHISPCKYKLGDTDTQFQGVQTPSSQVLLTYSTVLCSGTAPVYDCFRCLDFPMETRVGTGASYHTSSHRRWQLKSEGWRGRGSMACFIRLSGNVFAGVYGEWKCHPGSAISRRFKSCKCLIMVKKSPPSLLKPSWGFLFFSSPLFLSHSLKCI